MTKPNVDFLQEFIDHTSELIFMLSVEGDFWFVNNAFVERLGYSREEMHTKNLESILHPEYKDAVYTNLDRVKNGEVVHDFLMVFRTTERNRIYLLGEVTCKYLNGKPNSYRCLFRDITSRRRAEIAQNLYHTIAQINLSSRNLEDFLSQVHKNLQKNIYANNFFVAIFEAESNSIYFPYHRDEYYETGQSYIKRNLGNGIIEYAIIQNKPLIYNKEELQSLIDKEKLFIYESILPEVTVLVPLKIQEKSIGVIGIKSYSDATKFSTNDMELLEFVSGQIAISMERKKAEESLMLQTAKLNAIFDSSTHVIWTVNRKRNISSFNKYYYNLIFEKLGISPATGDSVEKLGWRLVYPEDKPLLREHYNLAFNGIPQYFEMHWGQVDGGDEWYEFYLNPIISSENGEIDEVSGIARNITDKKNALLSIQRSEGKFRDIIDSFIDIYYRTDLAGNITMISPSVLTHTGYTEEEVTGQKVDKFFENALDSAKGIKSLLKSGSITNFEVMVKRKDLTLRQFMLNIRMIKDSKGIPIEVEGVARDISDLRNATDQLLVAKNEAEHSLKVKEQFLANMSHEIRTPMNGIIGMIDVLGETQLNPAQKEYVNTIKKSSETLLTILNDILDLSKIEAGKMEILYVPVDIQEILQNLIDLYKQKALEKSNILSFKLDSNVPRYIKGDQIRLLQILSNLTSNALKFTQNGKVTIQVSTDKKSSSKQMIMFKVIDTGMGISKENQKKLFNSFQQLDISTKKSFGGTGLGLSISKELCSKMGGKIGLESEEGKGSTFWFSIYTEESSETEIIKINKEENSQIKITGYFDTKQPKILLVDDNSINRKVASEILKTANCIIQTASSGKKAIEVYSKDQDFDVILMDIQMPEMDGIETTQILKSKFGSSLPPVVAMTAYSMPNDKEKFLSQGMDDYISKPIRANKLIKKISDLVNHVSEGSYEEKVKIEYTRYDFATINSLREMVGNEMLSSVFEDFEREATEQIQNTLNAFKINDVTTIQKELHTLKGNSGTLGLTKIYEITAEIENPSKKGDLDGFEEKSKILLLEFEHFKNAYKSW
ncbi:MAG: PAS domain S-box protein [Leadbetterella sp.]